MSVDTPKPTASSSTVGRWFVRLLHLNVPVIGKAVRVVLGSDIYCDVPQDLILPHPYGITIHYATKLGRNVVIMQHVTLGGYHDRSWGEAPTIEDDVYVGAGAVVLGPITVGRGAVVGANAVVTRDVPPEATVVGANRIVMSEARTETNDDSS